MLLSPLLNFTIRLPLLFLHLLWNHLNLSMRNSLVISPPCCSLLTWSSFWLSVWRFLLGWGWWWCTGMLKVPEQWLLSSTAADINCRASVMSWVWFQRQAWVTGITWCRSLALVTFFGSEILLAFLLSNITVVLWRISCLAAWSCSGDRAWPLAEVGALWREFYT